MYKQIVVSSRKRSIEWSNKNRMLVNKKKEFNYHKSSNSQEYNNINYKKKLNNLQQNRHLKRITLQRIRF